MPHELVCWKCGGSLSALSLPLSRRDVCTSCGVDLHVCRMCMDFDPNVADQCREPTADTVYDKQRANFCDHYRPKAQAWQGQDGSEVDAARAALDKLFGK